MKQFNYQRGPYCQQVASWPYLSEVLVIRTAVNVVRKGEVVREPCPSSLAFEGPEESSLAFEGCLVSVVDVNALEEFDLLHLLEFDTQHLFYRRELS